MHECLPLDDRVRRIGIPLVSSCGCCSFRACEDIDHIFAKGDFAEELWRMCSLLLEVPSLEGRPWKDSVACWHRRARNSSCSGELFGLLPSILAWCLWGCRCKARMEGVAESVQSVWCSIRFWISWATMKLMAAKSFSRRDEDVLHCLNLPFPPARKIYSCIYGPVEAS